MKNTYDVIVVGGGVLGTFHAFHAVKKGLKVALIEKDLRPMQATVRNFGQVVPSGMDTKWQNYGRESLRIYKDLQAQFDISIRNNGSVYLASNQEEVTLIEELAQINRGNGYASQLLTKEECLLKYPGVRADYVKAGLFFPEEVTAEPDTMIHKLHAFMRQEENLDIFYQTQIVEVEEVAGRVLIKASNKQHYTAAKLIICCGHEFKTLYPEVFAASDLEVTKLQMLQTKVQPNYALKGSILTGLSIRRYEAFQECPSYKEIKALEDPNAFEKKWGVHILFKQATDGSVIIGDSHEYADAMQADDLGFDLKTAVNNFMIEEAKKIIDLPTYEVHHAWYGMYAQCKESDIFNEKISDNIHIVTGIGGKGMTGSAGFSKENIEYILN